MARTKQTARKSASGGPTLSRNEARRLVAARAEARHRGGKESRTVLQSPEDTNQVQWHCGKSEGTNGQQSC